MKYHLVIMPLCFWDSYTITSLEKLDQLMVTVGNLFSFSETEILKDTDSVFDLPLPNIKNHVIGKKDITMYVREISEENSLSLKIENVFLLDYGIEFISNDELIINSYHESLISNFLDKIIKKHYNTDEILYSYSNAVILKIIICDNVVELNSIIITHGMKEFKKGIFIGTDNTGRFYDDHIYNSHGEHLRFYENNPITFLVPEQLDEEFGYIGEENVGAFLSILYSLGFIHILIEAIASISGNLEYSSWHLPDLFDNNENNLCYLQRNLFSQRKNINETIKKTWKNVNYLLTFTTDESYERISNTYGEYFPNVVYDFMNSIKYAELRGYGLKYDSVKSEMSKSLINLSNVLKDYYGELILNKNEWFKTHSDNIINNKFIITMWLSFITLIVTIISLFKK